MKEEVKREIEAARKKRQRREKLTDREWKLIAYSSQQCACGGRSWD